MLSIDHLHKRFGDRVAIDDVSFAVRDGETVGLLGPNGAGKTTTLSMMSGLGQPDSGSVSFQGQLVRQDAILSFSAGCMDSRVPSSRDAATTCWHWWAWQIAATISSSSSAVA